MKTHFGEATARTVGRYYNHLKENILSNPQHPDQLLEDYIQFDMIIFKIGQEVIGDYGLGFIRSRVRSYERTLIERKYPELIREICSEGGNIAGDKIDQRLTSWGKEWIDVQTSLREISKKRKMLSISTATAEDGEPKPVLGNLSKQLFT